MPDSSNPFGMSDHAYYAYVEKRFSVYLACHLYAYYFHDGQFSRSYILGCNVERKGLRPGALGMIEDNLDPEARILYNRLVERSY